MMHYFRSILFSVCLFVNRRICSRLRFTFQQTTFEISQLNSWIQMCAQFRAWIFSFFDFQHPNKEMHLKNVVVIEALNLRFFSHLFPSPRHVGFFFSFFFGVMCYIWLTIICKGFYMLAPNNEWFPLFWPRFFFSSSFFVCVCMDVLPCEKRLVCVLYWENE